jgi:hypothetical protein
MSLYDRDRGDEFRRNLAVAQAPIVALARLLERAAFQERPEQSNHRRIMDNPAGFDPAPLYLEQARVLNMSHPLRRDLIASLEAMYRRHGR